MGPPKIVLAGWIILAGVPQLANADPLTLPLSQSASSSATLFSLENKGSGLVASFTGGVELNGSVRASDSITVSSGILIDPLRKNTGTLADGLRFGGTDTFGPLVNGLATLPTNSVGIVSNQAVGPDQGGLNFITGRKTRLSVSNDGKVGIGTLAPTRPLEVMSEGDAEIGIVSSDRGGHVWTLQSSGAPSHSTGNFQIVDRTVNKTMLTIENTGVVSVGVLQINGGSDLAEPFQVSNADIAAGSVVSIDENNPGKLIISTRAYDSRVAGIVSGANGVRPGIILQQGGFSDGGRNIALTGRVYALADASLAPIAPGDFLTSSSVSGRVMKVTDHAKAQGAIIGKAMSSLEGGQGKVLVLVSLQ
jgi:hypothetical protein